MSKYTTIAQIKADIKLSYAKILDFYSELQADAHGMAYLIVEMKDNTTLAELEALYFTPAVITDMEGKNIYSGICVSVAIENQDGYQKLILELSDLEVAADMSRKTRTFQSPGKKLSDILDEVLQEYGCNVQLEQNPAIPTVVYQQNETDWQFACRMINSFGMHMYSCCRGTHMAITGGTKGGRVFDNKILEKQKSRSRNVNELRAVQANEDSTAVSYQAHHIQFMVHNIHRCPFFGHEKDFFPLREKFRYHISDCLAFPRSRRSFNNQTFSGSRRLNCLNLAGIRRYGTSSRMSSRATRI